MNISIVEACVVRSALGMAIAKGTREFYITIDLTPWGGIKSQSRRPFLNRQNLPGAQGRTTGERGLTASALEVTINRLG